MLVYGQLDQDNVNVIIKEAFPIWEIRLLVYKEELFKTFTFHDTAFLPLEGLRPLEEYTACVEYVAIRGEFMSTCDFERIPFTSASAGTLFNFIFS